MIFFTFPLLLLLAYLLGSINSAILVCKLLGLPDPRQQGSGNPGVTNVLRYGSKVAAAWVLIGDVLKGVIPVIIASWFNIHGFLLGLIGLAAIVGHMYPLFFRLQGGKGVATTFGVVFALSFTLGLIALGIFVAIVILTRYVSLGSLCSISSLPILTLLFEASYCIPFIAIALLVIYRHSDNIRRLWNGSESKLKF